ncbi:uncharacterized protein [Arachis hypogaea]|uniref:uncharacterized protein n=1 Tax=Arachis hypogaea TaxID=3818 RepID=UPI003B20FE7C
MLSISSLLKLEGDREAMEEYLGEKAPTLTTVNLKAFVKKAKKKEKEGSSINVAKDSDVDVRCSFCGLSGGKSKMKKRGDTSSRVVDLTKLKENSGVFMAEETNVAHQSQLVFHEYKEGPMNLLWTKSYPFMAIVDEFA